MSRRQKKHHIIYKTTCSVTGRWYLGIHSTDDIHDGYYGSGRRLKASVKKYGLTKHSTVILEYLPDRKMLLQREAELITDEMLADPMCMNLMPGGGGSNGYECITSEEQMEEYRLRLVAANKRKFLDPLTKEKRKCTAKKTYETPDYQERISVVNKQTWQQDGYREKMRQKKLDLWKNPEYAEKMKAKVKETNARNIGMIWVHRENEKAKRIQPEQLDELLSMGYLKGKGKPGRSTKNNVQNVISVI